MRKLLTIGFTLAGCFLAAYFLWTPPVEEITEEEEEHHHHDYLAFSKELSKSNDIEIETVSHGKLKQKVRAPAQIQIISDQEAHIHPKVSGIAITAYKNLGENVSAGEIVAILESKEMAEAKANYLTALKKEHLATLLFDREKSLHEKNISSKQDFNKAEGAKEEAQIERELAIQKLFTLGLDNEDIRQLPYETSDKLRTYQLRSPISGKVIARHITPGESMSTDQEAYIIADLSTVWAEIKVFSHDRPFVKQGQTVAVTNSEGKKVHTKVAYLSPIIDADTRTSTAIVKLDNRSEAWLPGSYVQAEFITDKINVPVIVRKDAIQNIDGVDVVFVSSADGYAVRPITKGRIDEEHCEVISGLQPGEDYACKNTFLLKADLKKEEAEHMD